MSKFGISQPVLRKEDQRLLVGKGEFIDDMVWADQARGYFLRASVAHANIRSIDVSAAKAAPGVVGVLTGHDLGESNEISSGVIKNRDGSNGVKPKRPLLATDKIAHAGQAVALIVAETIDQAKSAAELIEVDYEELPAVVEMRAALAPGAPQVHAEAPGNLCFDWGLGDEAAVDAALASSEHVVSLDLVNNRVISNPMETRGVIAGWDAAEGKIHVETNGQGVWNPKNEISKRLGLEPEKTHVTTSADVGGGFGTKAYPYPEQAAVAFAARALGRPVKWIAERQEGFLADSAGRDHLTTATAGFDKNLRLTALKVETMAGLGGHLSPFSLMIPTGAASRVLPGVYDIQTIFYGVKGVFTNTTPVDAYRGAGRPESIYMIERLMDKSARELGVPVDEIRRRNFIRPDQMPYKTAVGETYDTGEFEGVMSAALEKADVGGFAARKAASKAKGKARGFGLASYIESILGDPSETAKLVVAQDGMLEIYVGTQANGQGHETAFAQILNQRIGVPFDKVRVVMGDSDKIAKGGGTGGSRSVTTQGTAISAAGDSLVEQLKPLAEEELEVSSADLEFRDGAFHIAGADRSVDLISLGLKARQKGQATLASVEETTTLPGRSFPNGCHIAEIEIDLATGVIEIDRYTMVDDFGVLINPMLAAGQAFGGVVQGIGQAVTESVAYDEGGQLLSGSFMDYAMPRADDVPWMTFTPHPVPSTANPLGMKGCGEAGTVGALPAVANAALDALWDLGVRRVDMPLTPSKVWAVIQEASVARTAAE